MQEMNPNYKNYKFLAGIWKSNDGSFTADLTVLENITVTCSDSDQLPQIHSENTLCGYVACD